jgi:hypothetical protein
VNPINTIQYFYSIILLSLAIFGILIYKKLNTPFKILSISTVAAFLVNIAATLCVKRFHTNAPALHVEGLSLFIFYSLIYYYLFTNKIIKTIVITTVTIVSVFAVVNALILQPFLTVFPTNVNLPTFAILTILPLLLFRQMLLSPLKTPLLDQGAFWYNAAILFSSTTQFLIIGLSNYQARTHRFQAYLFYLWYVILFIFAALVALALFKAGKEKENYAS